MYERINFQTSDGVKIAGDYYFAPEPVGYALLLHMMPAVKESWQSLAKALNQAQFSALAIDLRGHGESIHKADGSSLNYKDFSDEQHQSTILDVRGAMEWLVNKGAVRSKVVVIGASIGANLALQYLSENHDIPTAVLLSPGLDFRGIKTGALVPKLEAEQSFLCVASLNDKYSFDSCRDLAQQGQVKGVPRENIQLGDAGHGTHMFSAEPNLIGRVVEWVSERVK